MALKSKSKTKTKKPSNERDVAETDTELINEVASFASSLGLSSTSPGFNDAHFRKSGTLKPAKKLESSKPRGDNGGTTKKDLSHPRPSTKPKIVAFDDSKSWKFNKYKDLPKLPLVKANVLGVWHQDAVAIEAKLVGEDKDGMKLQVPLDGVEEWKRLVESKRELAERLLVQYVQEYEVGRGKSGDVKMLMATQRSGTAADKVSAFSVLVGDNPIANLRSLDSLVGMVTSKVGKRHALTGFEALRELFTTSLLPDRKLKTLLQRPIDKLPENKDGYSLLLLWYFEDCLKQRYERFVFALEEASKDMLPVLKDKSLKTMYILLKSKPEQERRLLSALVNKFGDPQNKSASNADFHLSTLLSNHPSMKSVVIDEVDSFLFRPHLGLRAKYTAINFLSQIRLDRGGNGAKVAKRLIDVYFAVFQVLITEAGDTRNKNNKPRREKSLGTSDKTDMTKCVSDSHVELDSRLLSALLTGINRAFPYVASSEADDIIEVQTPMLFQLVHSKNFNVGVQALMLLNKISSKNQIASDRFYRALYSKLLLPAAMYSSKAEMFIGLIMRAMKNDVNLKRVSAFSKRLLQVALQQPPQYACGCLFLLSEVLKARPPLWNMVLQNESVDSDIEHFEDIVEDAGNGKLTLSKKKRINKKAVLVVPHNDDTLAVEDNSVEDEAGNLEYDEDDVSYESDGVLLRDDSKDRLETLRKSDDGQEPQVSPKSTLPGGYNPRHREPSYCNADRASWWELTVLASHAHPSVSTMAGTLLSGANIVYNGNPLNDLSLGAFLDKFMEKKPKQSTWHGGSQIEPVKKLDMNNHLIGPEILSLAEMDVPPEDLVFHKFYTNKMNSTSTSKKKKKKKVVEEEEAAEEFFGVDGGGDESDNEEIENMLDSADLSFEANGEYDYDDLDKVADKDDDDLICNISDTEVDDLSDIVEGDFDDIPRIANEHSENEDFDFGDADDIEPDRDNFNNKRRRKRKSSGKAGASPFASLEEYAHLVNNDGSDNESHEGKKSKMQKKRRSSEDDESAEKKPGKKNKTKTQKKSH